MVQTAVSLAVVRRKVEEYASRIQSNSNVALYNRQRRGNPDNLVYKYYSKRHKGIYWTVDSSKVPKA